MGNLAEYLTSVADKPFEWGRHDCLSFADRAVRLQRGSGFADEWLGQYKSARAAVIYYRRKTAVSTRYATLVDVADDRLTRIDTFYPAFGNIIGRAMAGRGIGWAFGVATAKGVAFVGDHGLEFVEPTHTDLVWRP